MKIVFLDAKSIGEDIDLSGYKALGEIITYDFSSQKKSRIVSAMQMLSF